MHEQCTPSTLRVSTRMKMPLKGSPRAFRYFRESQFRLRYFSNCAPVNCAPQRSSGSCAYRSGYFSRVSPSERESRARKLVASSNGLSRARPMLRDERRDFGIDASIVSPMCPMDPSLQVRTGTNQHISLQHASKEQRTRDRHQVRYQHTAVISICMFTNALIAASRRGRAAIF